MLRYLLACLALLCAGAAFAVEPTYTLYTASARGTYYRFAEDIQRACPALTINVVSTDGSLDNINQLISPGVFRAGHRFAFVQNDALASIINTEPVARKLIRPVMVMYREDISILVNRGSGIKSMKDLNNKRVAIGSPGSGVWFTANAIRQQLQLNWIPVEKSPEESILSVLVGDIDAMIAVGGSPMKMFTEMGSYVKQHVELVNLSDAQLNKLYSASNLPEGTYLWQDRVVELRTTRSSLVTSSDVPPQAVDALLRCISANLPELRRWGHQKWNDVQLPPKLKK